MITFTWTIENLERRTVDGFIKVAHWRCTGVDGDYSASSYGTVGLTPDPSSPDFTPYADVTEAQAQGWVWDSVSQADTESALAANIENQKNPTEASGNPWAA